MHTVLVADDEPSILGLVSRWSRGLGYDVKTVAAAVDALTLLAKCQPSAVLSDVGMPEHDGLWLAERVRERSPDTAVIMMTGAQDMDTVVKSLRTGAIDFLQKPFDLNALRAALDRGILWHEAAVAARKRQEDLEQGLRDQVKSLLAALRSLEAHSEATIETMMSMLCAHDPIACAHGRRVAEQSLAMGKLLHLNKADLSILERAALLHDVGKIAIPQQVLSKPGGLTQDERATIARHPELGYDLVKNLPFLTGVGDVVLSAHEWFNGSGYPRSLRGDEIPLGSRIIAVADAFDAMTHQRSYREPLSREQAMIEIVAASGSQFDPEVVKAFLFVVDGETSGPRPVSLTAAA